ncbi:MAG TPA: hypothetical protein ACN46X_03185, partial [Prochlorococcus sp.]
MSFSEKLIIALILIRAIPLIWAAVSKITDLIAPDQCFGCWESDGMCIGGNQAFCITYAINFKIMTTSNSDYPGEILDQELSFTELEN